GQRFRTREEQQTGDPEIVRVGPQQRPGERVAGGRLQLVPATGGELVDPARGAAFAGIWPAPDEPPLLEAIERRIDGGEAHVGHGALAPNPRVQPVRMGGTVHEEQEQGEFRGSGAGSGARHGDNVYGWSKWRVKIRDR